MQNAFGEPQTILLLGGTSDIGVAIVRKLVSPTLRHVVLAVRDRAKAESVAQELRSDDVAVTIVEFDATETKSHAGIIEKVVADVGDLDVVIMAFGVLGEQSAFDSDPAAAADAVQINF